MWNNKLFVATKNIGDLKTDEIGKNWTKINISTQITQTSQLFLLGVTCRLEECTFLINYAYNMTFLVKVKDKIGIQVRDLGPIGGPATTKVSHCEEMMTFGFFYL